MNSTAKGLIAVLVVAVPALFNYLSARGDSGEAKVRAEVAYSMTVESVKSLEETVHSLELDVARLQAQAQERALRAAPIVREPKETAIALPPPLPAPEHHHQMRSAPAFEDAVQSYKEMRGGAEMKAAKK